MGRLVNRTAIVTGAGQGVGHGIALALSKEGAAVTVAGRTYEKVERTAKEITDLGGRALAIKADVAERAEVDAMVAATLEEFGPPTILVNNAQSSGQAPLEQLTFDEVWRDFSTGPLASLYCMQACFPSLKAHGGTIINFGSTAAITGYSTFGPYAIAKEGIRGLTKVAAREWGRHNITVNMICPSANAPVTAEFLDAHPDYNERLERFLKETSLGRRGDPEHDIGGACVALATADLGFLTGAILLLDGGRCILT